MRFDRTKNATRNMTAGMALKICQTVVPFFMRSILIRYMGAQYLGLGSLFQSVLRVLNIAELGVGSAMVYSMYKPVAEDDKPTIFALMKLYRKYYRIIGAIIACAGLIIMPYIPHLIHGGVPDGINVYILYLLNLGNAVLSYWLFAYRNCLLLAYQINYVNSLVSLIISIVQYTLQFIVLAVWKNYYAYLSMAMGAQVAANIINAIITVKLFKGYKPEGELERSKVKEISVHIRDLFTSKIGAMVTDSADTIVISATLGLAQLAVYQNYYYVMHSLYVLLAEISHACTSGIGNSIVVETKEKNYNDFSKFTLLICWVTGVCASCLMCCYQPFMRLWMGNDYLLNLVAIVGFCLNFYIISINLVFNTYRDAGGVWHKDRFRPLITAISNLILNFVFVRLWGVFGIIIATCLANGIVSMPWLLYSLFSSIFDVTELKDFLKKIAFYFVITTTSCFGCYKVCSLLTLNPFLEFIISGLICIIITNFVFLLSFSKMQEFVGAVMIVDKMLKNKLRLKDNLTIIGLIR